MFDFENLEVYKKAKAFNSLIRNQILIPGTLDAATKNQNFGQRARNLFAGRYIFLVYPNNKAKFSPVNRIPRTATS